MLVISVVALSAMIIIPRALNEFDYCYPQRAHKRLLSWGYGLFLLLVYWGAFASCVGLTLLNEEHPGIVALAMFVPSVFVAVGKYVVLGKSPVYSLGRSLWREAVLLVLAAVVQLLVILVILAFSDLGSGFVGPT